MSSDIQFWFMGGIISILITVLGYIIVKVADKIGIKIDETVKVNKELITEITKINEQIKWLFNHSQKLDNCYEDCSNRIHFIEIEHAGKSKNCK